MKSNRFWLEIIAIGTAIALAIALLIATLGAAAVSVAAQDYAARESAAPPTKTYMGMVTCTRCLAKHSAASGRTATNCVLICVHNGARFALIDGDKVYQLTGDVSLLKKFAGQRAQITGAAQDNTITVTSATAAS